jgi:hypothetical protein
MIGNPGKSMGVCLMVALFSLTRFVGADPTPSVSAFSVNNGVATTVNPAVTLANTCTGATSATHFYQASESPSFTDATWLPYAPVPLFFLSGGDGEKRVYFKVKNAEGVESPTVNDTIRFIGTGASVVAWGYNNYGQCAVPRPNVDYIAIAGGGRHTLGLKSNGVVQTWGRNNYNQCTVPSPNQNFVAVSAGAWFSLGLKADGSIEAWGNNSSGQCKVPVPSLGFVSVAAGTQHALGLKTDGSIRAWGANTKQQCDVPAPNRDFVAVAAGEAHSLGLKTDGSIVAWGYNFYNQCKVPLPNQNFIAISAAGNHSVALKADGSVVAWGQNEHTECDVPSPNRDFVAVTAGEWHCLGLKSDGSIVAWGADNYDQDVVSLPNRGFAAVAAGEYHSLALAVEGDLQVLLSPPAALTAGARWRITEDPADVWRNSGDLIALPVGNHTVELFDDLAGWYAQPLTQTVTIRGHELTTTTCVYVPGQTWSLSVTAEHGSVTRSPLRNNYRPGTSVTLTATADPNWHFTEWSGDLTTTTNPAALTMDSAKTVTAHFALNAYTLTIETTSTMGTVSASPESSTYPHGSVVTLTATPKSGYRFVRWEGDIPPGSETTNPLTLTLTENRTVRAVFVRMTSVPQWLMSQGEKTRGPKGMAPGSWT